MCEKTNLNFDTFNVCSNSLHSIKYIANIVLKISKFKKFIKISKKKANIDYQFCSNLKARKILNWKSKTSLDYGIRKTFEDIKKRIS